MGQTLEEAVLLAQPDLPDLQDLMGLLDLLDPMVFQEFLEIMAFLDHPGCLDLSVTKDHQVNSLSILER